MKAVLQKIKDRLGLLRLIYGFKAWDDGVLRAYIEIMLERDNESPEMFKI